METEQKKISCQICGSLEHVIPAHLKEAHPDWTVDRYRMTYPHAPLLSEYAQARLAAKKAAEAKVETVATAEAPVAPAVEPTVDGITKRAMHEAFELGNVKAAKNARGEPIMITTIAPGGPNAQFVPTKDPNYVFNIDQLKVVLMGMELGLPVYLWGLHGTGKTTLLEQVAAHTHRPFLRVQHTINTEESHIVGSYVVRDGATLFELGPLPFAMLNGLTYCADEYDFAMPAVLAVYQPVLEGKPLVIKEAPPEQRVIRPHRDFRFVATGNTNGAGDETGLYQGTQIGNAANYSRFGIVEEIGYMPKDQEIAVVSSQSGIDESDADKLIKYASEVRQAFKGSQIGATISPRELINAARLGLVRGGDWRGGLKLAFANRLSRTDKEAVDQFAQRIFG